ncbi:hypothetical protein TNCT_288211 [Trichonephila clavata]|uniref:Uncharacterized protein n=1 Tax=Trichonephila clavata TaxID=2740835 RepID=A0A8X6IJD6_TRICU|nr:hypothetical protein TNCT_288211 [Trichonephila clavata]
MADFKRVRESKSRYCESLKKIKDIYLLNQEDISAEEIAEYLGNDVSAHKSISHRNILILKRDETTFRV